MASNYWRAKMILENNKKRWLKLNPRLTETSGIYILTRVDENGFKFCYVGQAKHILTRLAQHLSSYQHIDLSLKKHKLYDEVKNPYGWKVEYLMATEDKLNDLEQSEIKHYANLGYQMRNKTIGSQGEGKVGLNENKAPKGYHDGLKQGRINTLKEVKEYFVKYLNAITKYDPECYKKNGELKEIYKKKLVEFQELLEGEEDE